MCISALKNVSYINMKNSEIPISVLLNSISLYNSTVTMCL